MAARGAEKGRIICMLSDIDITFASSDYTRAEKKKKTPCLIYESDHFKIWHEF